MTVRLYIIFTVLFGTAACVSQPAVDVYLTNITPMPSTLFEQRARLALRIQNLSQKPLEARGLDLRLVINDRQLARGVDNTPFTLPGLGEATASVVVSSSVFDTVRQLLGLRDRQVFSYGLKGKIHTGGMGKRFSRSGELTRAQLQALTTNN